MILKYVHVIMEFIKKNGGLLLVVFLGTLAAMSVHQKFIASRIAPTKKA